MGDTIREFVNDKINKLKLQQNNNEYDETQYVDVLLTIIRDYLPIIYKHNRHLHDNIRSAIELVLDQSAGLDIEREISEETIQDVEQIIKELG